MKKFIALFMFAVFFALTLFAPILFAQESEGGAAMSSELFLQISSLPEAKLGFNQGFKFPLLQGDGSNPLVSGNNVNLVLSAEVTPISVDGIFKTVFTPIAFLEFSAGGKIGSGWFLKFGDGYIRGIGLNYSDNDEGYSEYDGSAFDSINWRVFGGGLFQFSLAALIPGDWTHVVMQTYHEISYRANTRASNGESWYYENDAGENRNGLVYSGNILFGYQMPRRPLFLNMIAFQAELGKCLYNQPGGKVWGDDLISWHFAGVLQFAFTNNFDVFLLAQFRSQRNFIEENADSLFYQNQTLNTSDPLRVEFYRVAAAIVYRF